jgi:hypothetical protein
MDTHKSLSKLLNTISFWAITTIAILYVIMLLVITILTPETAYIKKKPISFVIESIAFPTFACLPLLFFAYSRNLSFKDTMIFVLSFWVKLLILHILFEVSGFYNWMIESLKPTI